MYYRINYNAPAPTGRLRTFAILREAKDPKDARAKAETELAKEHDAFNITSVTLYPPKTGVT